MMSVKLDSTRRERHGETEVRRYSYAESERGMPTGYDGRVPLGGCLTATVSSTPSTEFRAGRYHPDENALERFGETDRRTAGSKFLGHTKNCLFSEKL